MDITTAVFGECGNCKFWDSIVPDPLDNLGVCKRYPPFSVLLENKLTFEQPVTASYDYCGEYWAKE
jgi:hypothetical protein